MIVGASAERPMILAIGFPDRQVVDAGDPKPHQALRVEFPVLVAVTAEPGPAVVVPLIGKAHRNTVLAKCPKLLDQAIVELAAPFACQECHDVVAAVQE